MELLIVLFTLDKLLKDEYHKKGMDMHAYGPVDFKYLETLPKTFIFQKDCKFVFKHDNKTIRPKKILVDKETEFAGEFKLFVLLKENKFTLQ